MQRIVLLLFFLFSITVIASDNAQTVQAALHKKSIKIPESMKNVWGVEENSNYYTRYFAVHKLGKNLQPVEIENLFAFLHCKLESEPSMSSLEFNSIKNEIIILLMNQNVSIYPEISRELIGMYQDKTFDEVWRNYCVQFMGQIYAGLPEDERTFIKNTLKEAISEKKNSVGGTALIALKRVADENGFDKNELAKNAYSYMTDLETATINKVTALQICAQLNYQVVLEDTRKIAAANNENVSLRMSAIAAIGLMGDASDFELLNKLANNSDVRIQTAVKRAIKNIKSRT